VAADPNATEAQIASAASGLRAAFNGLVLLPTTPPVTAVLDALVGSLGAVTNADGAYSAASWTTFQNALTAAEAVLANPGATQAEVDSAVAALNAALIGLMPAGAGGGTPGTPGTPGGAGGSGDLPPTGSSTALPNVWLAALLMLAGAGLVAARRRTTAPGR
jgi:LPXTG-motif cell wall-anchored protein